jgi:secondary thiamine-phosphate synthase enzyme
MRYFQTRLRLPAVVEGFHLITDLLLAELPELETMRIGTANFFIQHTSASLFITENADPTVRRDFQEYFRRLAPDNAPYFQHTLEGPDDMTAHLKAAILGNSVTVPIADGRLLLGTWQGLCLGEHRRHGGRRWVVATLIGE